MLGGTLFYENEVIMLTNLEKVDTRQLHKFNRILGYIIIIFFCKLFLNKPEVIFSVVFLSSYGMPTFHI